MSAIQTIDTEIRRRHLLKHPFYQAWSRGDLSMPTLRHYATQYYHFESNFPRYVAGAYSKLSDPRQRRTLLENLVDEEGRAPTHPDLWLDFARGLGLRPATVRSSEADRPTRELCQTYDRWTLGPSSAGALGALYAYESIFPEVAAEKSRGLRAFYGLQDPESHEFFRVHTTADIAHSAAERALLRSAMASNPSESRRGLTATHDTLRAWWKFLDAFCA